MRRNAVIGIIVVLVAIALLAARPYLSSFILGKRRQNISFWISAPHQGRALESLLAHSNQISSISPMWYALDPDGRLEKAWRGDKRIPNIAVERGVLIIPTVSNQFDPARTAKILRSPGKRKRLIGEIVAAVRANDYDGIDLDFENMEARDRDAFTGFVRQLKGKFKPMGALVTIAAHAKTGDPGPWQGPQSHDYAALGRAADQVRVMAYDEHYAGGPPGPVASIEWVRRVARFAAKEMPPGKFVLGVPLYGYDWTPGARAEGIGYKTAIERARRFKARIRWDKRARSPWFTYELKGKRHTVWFENAESTAAKLDIASKTARGFSFFRLGVEDPDTWGAIGERIDAVY